MPAARDGRPTRAALVRVRVGVRVTVRVTVSVRVRVRVTVTVTVRVTVRVRAAVLKSEYSCAGRCFGEAALVAPLPRLEAAAAKTSCVVLVQPRAHAARPL